MALRLQAGRSIVLSAPSDFRPACLPARSPKINARNPSTASHGQKSYRADKTISAPVVKRRCTAAAIIFSLCLIGPTGIKAKQILEFCEYKKFQNLCEYAALTPVGPTTHRAKMKAGRPGVCPVLDCPRSSRTTNAATRQKESHV
jgi:hypothetical protein